MPKELRILKTWYGWDCLLQMPRAVLKKMPIELSFNRNTQRLDLGWDDQRETTNGKGFYEREPKPTANEIQIICCFTERWLFFKSRK